MKTAQLVALGATTAGGQIDLCGVHVATMLASGECTLTPEGEALLRSGSFPIVHGTATCSRLTSVVETVSVGAIGAAAAGVGAAAAVGAEA